MNLEWMDYAKCKNNTDINFFPEKGESGAEAIAFCQDCRVRRHCFDYSIKHLLDDGVWGGVSANRRNKYRRRLARQS